MSRHIPDAMRRAVFERAGFRCEYCRIPMSGSFFLFHIDHVVSIKHGGETVLDNLACACQICNLNKGSDIATFLDDLFVPVRLFNPRRDDWAVHFAADPSGLLLPKSPIGEATIKVLDLNHPETLIERAEMLRLGIY